MKMKFRKDKSLKAMQKINKVLLQFLNMNLSNTFTNVYNLVPERLTKVLYLPNCNLLDHILLQLQGLGKLMIRAIESSEIAAHHMEGKILIGHFWKVAFMTFSLVSRIRVLCKNLAVFACDLYQRLLPFRGQLKNNGYNILPDNYKFPDNLRVWLNAEEVLQSINVLELPQTKEQIRILIEDSDSDIDLEVEPNVKENEIISIESSKLRENAGKQTTENIVAIIAEEQAEKDLKEINKTVTNNEDVGVVIERSTVRKQLINKDTSDVRENITRIRNILELVEFMQKEDKVYSNNILNSPFKALNRMQWNMIKKVVKDTVLKVKRNKKKAKVHINVAKDALLLNLN